MTDQLQIFTGKVTDIAFGGNGIIKQEDGFVVFVPFTAIGDVVSYKIVEKRKSFATAELVNIVSPSPDRVNAHCPYFGTCGGCQFQHISYEAQATHKQQAVIDSLERIGRVTPPKLPALVKAEKQYSYRRHITLNIKVIDGQYKAGYISTDNKSLLPVRSCPIFVDLEDPIVSEVQDLVGSLKPASDADGRVTIMKVEDGFLFHFQFDTLPAQCMEIMNKALQKSTWKGILLSSSKQTWSMGHATTTWKMNDYTFSLSPMAFSQNYPEQSSKIYRQVADIAKKCRPVDALDLYCGIGITTILLSKEVGCKIVGIESNPTAIALARENATANGATKIEFQVGDVQTSALPYLQQYPHLVVLNPPRTGLDLGVMYALRMHPPKHIIYVSCMPPILARDLRLLCAWDYKIMSCQNYDMFPQTAHVETVVHLQR